MKCASLVVMSAILLLGSSNAKAQSENNEDIDILLGAAAGAAIGSTIGQGDGRKVATVLGGLIGMEIARDRSGYRYVGQRIDSYCRNQVPAQYKNNRGVTQSWINGCIARLEQQQAELERQAFEEALNQP